MKNTHQILFFSRGKGRGHAVPDAAIGEELIALEPNLDIVFVSYSVGAATLKSFGLKVIDLGLPEDPPLWDVVSRIVRVLREHRPVLVVSHEEFSAVPLSKAFGFRTIFLTDWFADANWPIMQSLRYADEIIFTDNPGYSDVPPYIRARVHYTGCVLRRLGRIDAQQARSKLGLSPGATVILVVPGGSSMHSEERAPVFDLILSAFDSLDVGEKKLIYVVSECDYQAGLRRVANRADVLIVKPHGTFTTTMMASDVVITTGNRTPILECEALGLPSLSLSFGHNPVDDQRISRVPTNTALRAKGLDPSLLADHLAKSVRRTRSISPQADSEASLGRLAAVERLRQHLHQGLI